MCLPALGGLGPLLQVFSVGVGVVGQLASAKAQSQAAQAQAEQNDRNAVIAARNAEDARERGNAAVQDQQLRTRARIGMQKNALSERNIAINSGSALDLLGDTAMFGKMDALTTANNFEREAISHQTQQMNFSAQAEMDRMAARNARMAGGISAFSTALGGAADYYKSTRKMTL